MKHTIKLVRKIDGKEHITYLKEDCHLHIEIVEKLFDKLTKRGITLDMDDLIDMVKEKK